MAGVFLVSVSGVLTWQGYIARADSPGELRGLLLWSVLTGLVCGLGVFFVLRSFRSVNWVTLVFSLGSLAVVAFVLIWWQMYKVATRGVDPIDVILHR